MTTKPFKNVWIDRNTFGEKSDRYANCINHVSSTIRDATYVLCSFINNKNSCLSWNNIASSKSICNYTRFT